MRGRSNQGTSPQLSVREGLPRQRCKSITMFDNRCGSTARSWLPLAMSLLVLGAPLWGGERSGPEGAAAPESIDLEELEERARDLESLLTQDPDTMPELTLKTSREPARYRIGVGDVISLTFPLAPEFDQELVAVMPDGFVSLKGVGDVWIAGKSLPEAREAVEEEYGKFLRDPVITVKLEEYEKPYFVAFGQVQTPGKYELTGDTTAAQALGIAGGFAETAKSDQLIVLRAVDGVWAEAIEIDARSLLRGGRLDEDIQLRPGDMLFVPRSKLSTLKQYIPRIGFGIGWRLGDRR